ncbi:MAG: YccF domain-containing protein [Candidatus Cryptobacteroides sp.]
MKFIGNIVWLILGGMVIALVYYIVGLLFCLTIIGIPFGFQLFKFGTFSLWPFGTQVIEGKDSIGCTNLFMNILWIILGWWEIALMHIFFGFILCITIIGIPFGMQHFKMAGLSLLPFGKTFK